LLHVKIVSVSNGLMFKCSAPVDAVDSSERAVILVPRFKRWKSFSWNIYFRIEGPPMRSSCQTSWPQIQRSGFDFRCYQIFWEVMGTERGPLSLLSTIEELLERKSSGSGLEIREYGRMDPSQLTLYPQKLALTSPTSGDRWIGIVCSRTQATEFSLG
jgi:hypothetical protein